MAEVKSRRIRTSKRHGADSAEWTYQPARALMKWIWMRQPWYGGMVQWAHGPKTERPSMETVHPCNADLLTR